MSDNEFTLFTAESDWRLARVHAGIVTWTNTPRDQVAAALREQGYAGRPIVLALPSADCLSVRVSTAGLPRGDRRAMVYRLEEQLPLAAEDVVADFAPVSAGDDVLAGCVVLDHVMETVNALESAGVAIGWIVPATLGAAQSLAQSLSPSLARDRDDQAKAATVLLLAEPPLTDAVSQLSVVTLEGGVPVDWALLPAVADDVQLHLKLISADRQIRPHVQAVGLDKDFCSALENALGWLVHRRDEEVAIAAAGFCSELLNGTARPWLDFRRDALAASDRLALHRPALSAALAAAAVLLVTLTAVLFYRSAAYSNAAARDQAEMRSHFTQQFPDFAMPADVRAVVSAERRKAASASSTPTAGEAAYGTALLTLRDVLTNLPEGNRFSLSALSVQDASLTLSGRMASFEQADALAAAARKSGMDVPQPQTRRSADGTWTFVLQGTRSAERSASAEGVPR